MKIIYNKWIPLNGFCAINIFGVLFVRTGCKVKSNVINHAEIHTAQMRELGYIGFYVLYFLEWIVRLFVATKTAYSGISFEREASENQYNYRYLKKRKPFAQWRR